MMCELFLFLLVGLEWEGKFTDQKERQKGKGKGKGKGNEGTGPSHSIKGNHSKKGREERRQTGERKGINQHYDHFEEDYSRILLRPS